MIRQSVLIVFALLGAQRAYATCDGRLQAPFAIVSEKLLRQGVVSVEQIAFAANSEVPVSPLQDETATTKSGHAIRYYRTMVTEPGVIERWPEIRWQLAEVLARHGSQDLIRREAERGTELVVSPREEHLPGDTAGALSKAGHWLTMKSGRTVYVIDRFGSIDVHEFPSGKQLAKLPAKVGFERLEEGPNGEVHLIFFREEARTLGLLEKFKNRGKTPYVRRILNLEGATISEVEFFIVRLEDSYRLIRSTDGPDLLRTVGGNFIILHETEPPAYVTIKYGVHDLDGRVVLSQLSNGEHYDYRLRLFDGRENPELHSGVFSLNLATLEWLKVLKSDGKFGFLAYGQSAPAGPVQALKYVAPSVTGGTAETLFTYGAVDSHQVLQTNSGRTLIFAAIRDGHLRIFEPSVSQHAILTLNAGETPVFAATEFQDQIYLGTSTAQDKIELYKVGSALEWIGEFPLPDNLTLERAEFRTDGTGQLYFKYVTTPRAGSAWSVPHAISLFHSPYQRAPQSVGSRPECERRLSVEPFAIVSENLLKQGVVSVEQLALAVNSVTPVNPLGHETPGTKSGHAIRYYRAMIAAPEVRERWPEIRKQLADVVAQHGARDLIRNEAKRETERVVSPREAKMPTLSENTMKTAGNWLTLKSGQTFYAVDRFAFGLGVHEFPSGNQVANFPQSGDSGFVRLEEGANGDVQAVFFRQELRNLNLFEKLKYRGKIRFVRRILNLNGETVSESEFFVPSRILNSYQLFRSKQGPDIISNDNGDMIILHEDKPPEFIGRMDLPFDVYELGGQIVLRETIWNGQDHDYKMRAFSPPDYPELHSGVFSLNLHNANLTLFKSGGQFGFLGTGRRDPVSRVDEVRYIAPSSTGGKAVTLVTDGPVRSAQVFETKSGRILILTATNDGFLKIFEPAVSRSPIVSLDCSGFIPKFAVTEFKNEIYLGVYTILETIDLYRLGASLDKIGEFKNSRRAHNTSLGFLTDGSGQLYFTYVAPENSGSSSEVVHGISLFHSPNADRETP